MATEGTPAPLLGEPLPVELMNTVWADRDGVHDALANDGDAASWLQAAAAGIAPRLRTGTASTTTAGPIDDAEFLAMSPVALAALAAQLRDVRDGARYLAATVTADPRPAAASATAERTIALDALNRACQATPNLVAIGLVLVWRANSHHVCRRNAARGGDRLAGRADGDAVRRPAKDRSPRLPGPRLRALLRQATPSPGVVFGRLRQPSPGRPPLRPAPQPAFVGVQETS